MAATPYIQVLLTSIMVCPKSSTKISTVDLSRPVSTDLLKQSSTIKVFLHSGFNIALLGAKALFLFEFEPLFLTE